MAHRCIVAIALLVVLGCATGLEVRSTVLAKVTANDRILDEVPSGKIERVIKMLQNLVDEMDAEEAADEAQFKEFHAWCTQQQAATQASIEKLQAQIEELTASLAELYAQKGELVDDIRRLDSEIKTTQSQIQQARDKRGEEHQSFIREQSDFDSSIAACNKAVEILKKHYGDGEEAAPPEKPSWMSLMQVAHSLREVVQRRGIDVGGSVQSFLEQPTEFGRFQSKSGEAGNIVDQMKMLAETFIEDKQSAIDEENRLQKLFNDLMKEKGELLTSLVAERASQQAVLDSVNQNIGEQESAKASAEGELQDETEYLATTKKTCDDTAALFEMRKKDRAEESLAVGEAIKVLGGSAGEGFVQLGRRPMGLLQVSASRVRTRLFGGGCPLCRKAGMMLQEDARRMKSGILATAAAATMGSEAVQDVITALDGLLDRIKEDQKMETEHKDWCVDEITETTQSKEHHEETVEELGQEIASETEIIGEKTVGIQNTASGQEAKPIHQMHGQLQGEGDNVKADIDTTDLSFEQATAFRAQEKEAFEKEDEEYKEALQALNQAIGILAKFYASKKKGASLVEEDQGVAPREMAPGVFDNVYQSKGGAGVVEMIGSVRSEFEQGKADAEKAEAQSVADYQKVKEEYHKTLTDLVSKLSLLIVQRQQSYTERDQYQEDKKQNEEEIRAEEAYLLQLQNSCNSLLEHYVERVTMRNEEKVAIKKAKTVLENEA